MLQETNRVPELNRRVQKLRRRLIEHSMPLAERVAARYQGESATLAHVDLEQEAMVGLIRAVNTFDRDKGASFKTWVEVKVKGAILDALRKQGHAVHLSENANGEYLAYERAVERLAQRYGAYPTDEEIAREMGTTAERARKIEAYVPEVVGLDVEDEDSGLTIEQTTPEVVEFQPDYSEFSEMILGALPGRDAYLLEASSGADGRGKRSRARIAEVTDLTEREVATELQRIKRGLRRDPLVLAIKKAVGYVTVAERNAERARRLAKLPQHPPGAPIVKKAPPERRPPAGVRRYTLTEDERLAVVARCEEKNPKRGEKSAPQGVSYEKSARYSKWRGAPKMRRFFCCCKSPHKRTRGGEYEHSRT